MPGPRWLLASLVALGAGAAALVVAACCGRGPGCGSTACARSSPREGTAARVPATAPAASGAQAPSPAGTAGAPPAPQGGRDVGRMHNVHAITRRMIRGSQPETEADFAELAKLGVKVVVSVDGARPDVASARKHGLRYVHVPMGYDGPSRAEQVLLYKAFATLEGPFYVHCHHGKHRGPAACAVGLLGVEGWTPEQVTAELTLAGTARKYEGLYAFPAQFERPTAEELAAAPAELPEVARVPGLTEAMVLVEKHWEHLALVKKAGWKPDPAHPDIRPKHEATILAQRYREMARLDEVVKAKPGLQHMTEESEKAAWDLAEALGANPVDSARAQVAFERIERSCLECHQAYRDTPAVAARR